MGTAVIPRIGTAGKSDRGQLEIRVEMKSIEPNVGRDGNVGISLTVGKSRS